MRVDRFTVLSFAFLLTALAAVVLWPTPVALASSGVPAEPCLTETGGEIPTLDAHSLAAVDAATTTGRNLLAAGASRSLAHSALSRAQRPPLGAHSDRSPPA